MRQDLRLDIKALRNQMANLEQRCQEREDKIAELFEVIAPFFEIMSDAQLESRIVEPAISSNDDDLIDLYDIALDDHYIDLL